MTAGGRPSPRAILLDIEGTTTPIAFVHRVLFPFARVRLREFLEAHRDEPRVRTLVDAFTVEHAADRAAGASPPPWDGTLDAAGAYAHWLMDLDRKSPALKQLQGWIWEEGYRAGQLKSEVYPDVAPAVRRWRAEGLDAAIYSSGSELAQRLLFGATPDGDLTPLFSRFFDTAVGPKTSPASYARIAAALDREPAEVVFISDVSAELRAAAAAGLQVRLSMRPGNADQPDAAAFEAIRSLEEI